MGNPKRYLQSILTMKSFRSIPYAFFASLCQCIVAFILLLLYVILTPRPSASGRFYIVIDILLPILIACTGAYVCYMAGRRHDATAHTVKNAAIKTALRFTAILLFLFLGYAVCTNAYLMNILDGNSILVLLPRNFLVYLIASAYPIAYALIELGSSVLKR